MRRIVLFAVLSSLLFCDDTIPYGIVRGYKSTIVSNPLSYCKVGGEIWGMGGAGVAMQGVPGIELLNPAGLKISGLSVLLDIGYQVKEKYIASDSFMGDEFIIPQFVSIAAGNKHLSGSAGFYHKFHQNIDFGTVDRVIIDGPDSAGYYDNNELFYNIYSVYMSSSYSFFDRLTVGATLAYNYYRHRGEMFFHSHKGDTYFTNTLLGVNIKLTDYLFCGLSTSFAGMAKMTWTQKYTGIIDTSFVGIDILDFEYIDQFSAPWIVNAGLLYNLNPDIKLAWSASYYEWNKIGNDVNNIPVAGLVNLGAEQVINELLSIQGGFFYQLYQCGKYEENTYGFTLGMGFEPEPGLMVSIYSMPLLVNTYSEDVWNYKGPWGEVTRFVNINLVYSFGKN